MFSVIRIEFNHQSCFQCSPRRPFSRTLYGMKENTNSGITCQSAPHGDGNDQYYCNSLNWHLNIEIPQSSIPLCPH